MLRVIRKCLDFFVVFFYRRITDFLRDKEIGAYTHLSQQLVATGVNKHNHQGRIQEFATGEGKSGDLGDGSPPAGSRGPGAEPRWGSGAKTQEAGVMLNIRLKKIHKNSTQQK